MSAVNALHVLFARVEPSYSPRGYTGYQVVYHSPQLSDAEVEIVEKRVQCFEPQIPATRYQYFELPSRRIVCTHSVPLDASDPDYQTVIDSDGREGAFIAHALVLSPDQFAQADNNPFRVFDGASFIKSIDGLREQVANPAEGVPVTVRRSRATPDGLSDLIQAGWPQEAARKLYLIARAGLDDPQLAFYGSPDKVQQIFRLALHLATADERRHLTFDTLIDRCQPSQGVYWAVGSTQRISRRSMQTVDVENPSLSVSDGSRYGDLYHHWIQQQLNTNQLLQSDVIQQMPVVQSVSVALEENRDLSAVTDDPATLSDIIAAHPPLFQERQTQLLQPYLGERLSQQYAQSRVMDYQQPHPVSPISHKQWLTMLAQDELLYPAALAQDVYAWTEKIALDELRSAPNLFGLAERGQHAKLAVLAELLQPPALHQRMMEFMTGLFSNKPPQSRIAEKLLSLPASQARTLVEEMEARFGDEVFNPLRNYTRKSRDKALMAIFNNR